MLSEVSSPSPQSDSVPLTLAEPVPGLVRFAWLCFFQPMTLHRLLVSWGVDPAASLWSQRQELRREGPLRRSVLRFLQLFVLSLLASYWSTTAHHPQFATTQTILLFVGFGTLCLLMSAALRMVQPLGLGLAFGFSTLVAANIPSGLGAGVSSGLFFFSLATLGFLEVGTAPRLRTGLLWISAACLAVGLKEGLSYGIGFGVASIAWITSVLGYLVSSLLMLLLLIRAKTGSARAYVELSRFLPYRHHDLLYAPLPGLRSFLVGLHRVSPQDGEARIAEALGSVGQKRPAQRALAALRAEGR